MAQELFSPDTLIFSAVLLASVSGVPFSSPDSCVPHMASCCRYSCCLPPHAADCPAR